MFSGMDAKIGLEVSDDVDSDEEITVRGLHRAIMQQES